MKKQLIITCMIISILFVGCATHIHNIGSGPKVGQKVTARQWYLFNGLVPINSVDTNAMADSAENYEIKTQIGAVDMGISIGLSMITFGIGPFIINSRTVTVIK